MKQPLDDVDTENNNQIVRPLVFVFFGFGEMKLKEISITHEQY